MVSVKLSHCWKCTFLPSLGKLSLLKDLCIEGMKKVKNVGLEFYSEASSSIKPFPSLKTLTFSDMPEWEEWLSSSESFPCLQVLRIFDCPKLIKKLPDHLPSLSKLYISFCPVLAVSLPRLPSLRELSVTHCNEVVLRNGVDLASLITLDLSNISQLTCLQEGLVRFLGALEVLRIHECNELNFLLHNGVGFQNLACVRRLSIGNCSQLVALSEEDHGSLPSLEHLWIEDCANLEKLPSGLKSFTSLMKLSIKKCPKLVSFPETGLPPMLRVLELNDCESLKSLPNGMMANSNNMELCLLEQLKIWKCSSLTCFPSGELPTTLMKLDIGLCENLQSLPKGLMHNSSTCHLEILKIFCCSSLMSFPRGYLPSSVKSLAISNWPQLQAISESWTNNNSLEYLQISELKIDNLGILHSLAHLTELDIHKCPGIESFPESGWSIPNLRMLRICFCENLKSLPHQMQNFTSLRDLDVYDCPSLVSFPEGGLPPNLTSFMIRDCQNLKTPLSEWGLHHLPFLKTLYLSNVIPSSDDECLPPLPTTLTFLHIGDFPNLKSLSSLSLQNLTSLETLQILGCPKLQYFLPKEGLPAALSILSILSCPILRERCQKDKGTDWPKISHIPCVDII